MLITERADRLTTLLLLCDPLAPQLAPFHLFAVHLFTMRCTDRLGKWCSCDAYDDLRALCERSGKQRHFEIFEAYDLAGGERSSYADLATLHGVAETTVTNDLAWARRTLRALVSDRMRAVTSGDRELREEKRRIWT